MWPVVQVSDLEARWRPLTESESTVATARLSDAEADVQLHLQERGLVDPPNDPAWVTTYVRTVVEMVRRYMLNPEGWLEETERLDDWSETKRRDSAVSTGALYVSVEEIERLLPRNRRRRGAFSVTLGAS